MIKPLECYAKVLHEYRNYWHFLPFAHALEGPPWHNPALQRALSKLNAAQIDAIDSSAEAQREFFSPYFEEVFELPAITRLASLSGSQQQKEVPFWLSNGIAGRKLSQIEAFIAQLPALAGTTLEWCAGKGHLGRLLRFHQHPVQGQVQSLEWQAPLCEQGRALAQQHNVAQTFHAVDVLHSPAARLLAASDHAIALHACGDLHRRLLEVGSAAGLDSLHVAPCCYHLIQSDTYQPLSTYGQQLETQQPLQLNKAQLKLAVQGQVTAGDRVRRLRHTETLWRLVYQLAREHYLNDSVYQPLPSINKQWFSGELLSFLSWACTRHGWQLPAGVDVESLERSARQRQLRMQQLDLVRHVFRRPLEQYLVLDRAVFLQEQGYQVELKQFCDYQVSPRNFLIQAERLSKSTATE